MKKICIAVPEDIAERMDEYARDYFGGSVTAALQYCFEEQEYFAPTIPISAYEEDDDEL